MTRVLARINRDEIVRMIKGVQQCGLAVSRVTFDGEKVDVIIGQIGDKPEPEVDATDERTGLIREPQP